MNFFSLLKYGLPQVEEKDFQKQIEMLFAAYVVHVSQGKFTIQ